MLPIVCRSLKPAKPVKPHPGQPSPKSKGLGFLDLPGEIRNTIYLLIFGDHHVFIQQSGRIRNQNQGRGEGGCRTTKRLTGRSIWYPNPADPAMWRGKPPQARANILRTCHQVHDEATALLYASTLCEFTAMNA